MTDAELIELLRETPPELLTAAHVAELRRRLPESSALQAALAEHLHWEGQVGEALGAVSVEVDRIYSGNSPGISPRMVGVAAAAIVVLSAAWLIWWLVGQAGPSGPERRADDSGALKTQGPDVSPAASGQEQPAQPVKDGAGDDAETADPPAGSNEPGTIPVEPPPGVSEAGEPWGHLLDQDGPPPAFEQICFDDFPPRQRQEDIDKLKRWFVPIEPNVLSFQRHGQELWLEGLVRLRAPWRKDCAMRLALNESEQFRIHVLRTEGDWAGVTLQFYPNLGGVWAAYRARRDHTAPRPDAVALLATDGDRYRRGNLGTLALYYQDGELILARGDVRLLTVPLPGPPEQVLFDGKAAWRGIEMFRSGPLPEDAVARPLVLNAQRPGDLGWRTTPDHAPLRAATDGSLELSPAVRGAEARASLSLVERGLYEVTFLLDQPRSGNGVFLGDSEGRPFYKLGVVAARREGAADGLALTFREPDDEQEDEQEHFNPREEVMPLVSGSLWLRMVYGCGAIKAWTSGDGKYWSRLPLEYPRDLRAEFDSLGVYCRSGGEANILRLTRLEIRELDGLTSLAPAELRGEAPPLDDVRELGSWLAQVGRGEQLGADSMAWRRACAIKALAGRANVELAGGILTGLLREVVQDSSLRLEDRLRALEDGALLADAWEGPLGPEFARLYELLAAALRREGREQPYSAIARAELMSPLWTSEEYPALLEAAARNELLQLANDSSWPAALETALRLAFWNAAGAWERDELPDNRRRLMRWVDWAGQTAARGLPADAAAVAAAAQFDFDPRWRHPLQQDISKEGFNVLAEFEAALSGQSWRDACQIIIAANPRQALGLLPDGKDERLMVSLPGAVNLAMRDRVELRRVMRDEFAPLGQLRVRAALADGSEQAVRAATVQFHGTQAAAEAHHFLGDRALSSGDVVRASSHYRQALQDAPPGSQAALEARLRLIAAMQGRSAGQPPQFPVEFAGERISVPEFEKLVAELLQRHAAPSGGASPAAAAAEPAPSPARYDARPFAVFGGTQGNDHNNIAEDIDWQARQTTVTPAGGALIVCDTFRLTAFNAASGSLTWDAPSDGNVAVHAWSGVSSRPGIQGDRLFVRRFRQSGPEIACFELSTGRILWTTDPQLRIASDALLVQDQLFAFDLVPQEDQVLRLRLLTLDAADGQLRSARQLAVVRDEFDGRLPVAAVAVGDKLLAAFAGGVLCCDLLGDPLWLRSQAWLRRLLSSHASARLIPLPLHPQPSPHRSLDGRAIRQPHRSPLVQGDRVIVGQRGVRAVECLELETGRLHWRYVDAEILGVVGATKERVVVESESGLIGLDAETGQLAWMRGDEHRHEAAWLGASGDLLYVGRDHASQDGYQPRLVWLDPSNGQARGWWPLRGLPGNDPLMGPICQWQGRSFVLSADGPRDVPRKLLELVKSDEPPLASPPPRDWQQTLAAWLPRERRGERDRENLAEHAAAVLPGWTLFSPTQGKQSGLQATWEGQSDVFVAFSARHQPVRLLRRAELPAGAAARLLLHVGRAGGATWRLEVLADGEPVLQEKLTDSSPAWLNKEIDLSSFAGRRVWLSFLARLEGDGNAQIGLKELRLLGVQGE